MKKGQIIFALIFNGGLILLISHLASGSLNPVEVYRGDKLLLKVIVSILGLLFLAALGQLPLRAMLENERCAACGQSIVDFMSSHGGPQRCLYCKRWYHKKCYTAGGGDMTGGCRREHCPSGQQLHG